MPTYFIMFFMMYIHVAQHSTGSGMVSSWTFPLESTLWRAALDFMPSPLSSNRNFVELLIMMQCLNAQDLLYIELNEWQISREQGRLAIVWP